MTAKPFQFDAAIKELEQITQWFETTDVDLDEGIAKFERGMELAAKLKDHLAAVDNKIEAIKAKFGQTASTSAPTDPFDGGVDDLLD